MFENYLVMKVLYTLLVMNVLLSSAFGQTTIYGKITDTKEEPLAGVNVYLKGSYDGSSTDENGNFKFNSDLQGSQLLIVSFIGFKTIEQEIDLSGKELHLELRMKESANNLDAVVISAGTFEAGDEKKSVVLKPLDIATTAGGLADIPGAINTLPGTQTVGEEGKLFVRGGDSYETKTYIDGMIVDKPYESTMPDVPSRGRFSPFLFKGTLFSSGGYSAEYGQALSSALILETTDLAPETVTSLSLMSVGLGAAHTHRWKNSSLSVSADYSNISPYFALVKQSFDWQKAPSGISGSLIFRQKTGKDGLLKVYSQISRDQSKLNFPDPSDVLKKDTISLLNDNAYVNATFHDSYGKKWISNGGVAYSHNIDNTGINDNRFKVTTNAMQLKYNLTFLMNENLSIKFGGDVQSRNYMQKYTDETRGMSYPNDFTDHLSALFTEAEWLVSSKFAARVGIRGEYSSWIGQANAAPRISLAYKTGKKSQVSFAYGAFYQMPDDPFVQYNPNLKFEKAMHYILNYQFIKNKRIFRVEAYYKDYNRLVKYDSLYSPKAETYNNNGKGYARGVDVFWRDNSFKNQEYWISYSYIDTKRNYRDYPVETTPQFVSNHNLSVVYKYWIQKISSEIGFTYKFASGRPFYNPMNPDFLADRTKAYNDLSFNISYLTNLWGKFTIVYFSAGNILGFDKVFGYTYSSVPDGSGKYNSYPVKPGAKRFLFLGIFISL